MAVPDTRARPPLRALAAGLALFAAGLALALAWLPEWRRQPLPERGFFVARYQEVARQLGLRPAPGTPRARLTVPERLYRGLHLPASDRLSAHQAAVSVEVFHRASQGDRLRELQILFSRDGRPVSLDWVAPSFTSFFQAQDFAADRPLLETACRLLLDPGEPLPDLQLRQETGGVFIEDAEVRGGAAVLSASSTFGTVSATRRLAASPFSRGGGGGFPFRATGSFLAGLGVAGLFLYLLFQRRLSLLNGALLAALSLLASEWPYILGAGFLFLIAVLVKPVALFVLWSAAESLLRSSDPGALTGLDALRTGGLGRRGGRALLAGFSWGAGLAGFLLALYAGALALPGTAARVPLLEVPLFQPNGGLLVGGFLTAGWVLLALALVSRYLPLRRHGPAVPLALALVFFFHGRVALSPGWLEAAALLVLAGTLAHVARRHGVTALLVASLSFFLLPATAFALLHWSWMWPSALLLAAGCLYLPVRGLWGLSRPAEIEAARVRPPAFVRRIEEERRAEYELDLLARMQLGLLPRELPQVPGYGFAAQSFLATEAGGDLYDFLRDADGGLWIAAGDVSGHGYSCAIAQAMTKAALASLIPSRRSPAAVLGRLHEVLKKGGPGRSFTTLTLLRLQPETGEAVLANAGHPAAFLAGDLAGGDEVAELAVPGLPLGQGPRREYREIRFTIPPGGALLLYSDGLFEAPDAGGEIYGIEQVREILSLSHSRARDAAEILDAVLAGWRRHRGEAPPADDTTLVVIRRAETGSGAASQSA